VLLVYLIAEIINGMEKWSLLPGEAPLKAQADFANVDV